MDLRDVTVTLSVVGNGQDLVIYPDRRVELSSDRKTARIGRASKVSSKGLLAARDNFWFDSPVMSRKHAEVVVDIDEQTVSIKDLGSMHGTFINDEARAIPRDELRIVADGDNIRFGVPVERGHEKFAPTTVKVGIKFPNAGSNSPQAVTFEVPDTSESEMDDNLTDDEQLSQPITKPINPDGPSNCSGIEGLSPRPYDLVDLTSPTMPLSPIVQPAPETFVQDSPVAREMDTDEERSDDSSDSEVGDYRCFPGLLERFRAQNPAVNLDDDEDDDSPENGDYEDEDEDEDDGEDQGDEEDDADSASFFESSGPMWDDADSISDDEEVSNSHDPESDRRVEDPPVVDASHQCGLREPSPSDAILPPSVRVLTALRSNDVQRSSDPLRHEFLAAREENRSKATEFLPIGGLSVIRGPRPSVCVSTDNVSANTIADPGVSLASAAELLPPMSLHPLSLPLGHVPQVEAEMELSPLLLSGQQFLNSPLARDPVPELVFHGDAMTSAVTYESYKRASTCGGLDGLVISDSSKPRRTHLGIKDIVEPEPRPAAVTPSPPTKRKASEISDGKPEDEDQRGPGAQPITPSSLCLASPDQNSSRVTTASPSSCSRPAKRLRTLAKQASIAALGGITVGAMVFSSLVYMAPDF